MKLVLCNLLTSYFIGRYECLPLLLSHKLLLSLSYLYTDGIALLVADHFLSSGHTFVPFSMLPV